MTNNDIKKISIDILERSDLPSGAEVIDMKSEDIDKLYKKKTENTAMGTILKTTKWDAHVAIRGEIGAWRQEYQGVDYFIRER